MANCATNNFYARTENRTDLDKIEAFLDNVFNAYVNRQSNSVDGEFTSRWEYPKDKIYIRILTHELENEYVSFRIFSQGEWNIKLQS